MSIHPQETVSVKREYPDFWFPGRWIGGLSLILGPLLLLTAALLRIQFHFFTMPNLLRILHTRYLSQLHIVVSY